MVVSRLQLLAVGASAAQPPRLDSGNTGVDAGDAHVPAAGVELVLGRKLAQRRYRGAFVLVDLLVVAALLPRTALAAPPDHRPQGDPLLRERVVGNESLVGQKLVGVAGVQAAQNALQSLALAGDLLDLVFPRFVGRIAPECTDAPAQRLDLGADCLALVGHFEQAIQDPNRERCPLAGVALQKLRQVVAGGGRQIVREGGQKALQQVVRVALHEVEEGIGEATQPRGFHVVEYRSDSTRHRPLGHSGRHPVVEAEGGELTFEHRRGVEEDARRVHPAREHVQGFGVEVEVVGLAGRHGHGQGVAVTSPRTPRALLVVLRRRRHRAHDDVGEIADVDAELQGRGGGEDVRLPRLRRGVRETLLQPVPLLALDEGGVLRRDDAPDGGLPVKLPEPRGRLRSGGAVLVLQPQVEARDAAPEVGFLLRDHDLRVLAAHDRHPRRGVEPLRLQRECVRLVRIQPAHETRGFQSTEHRLQDIGRVLGRRQRVERRQHLLNPPLIPGAGTLTALCQRLETSIATSAALLRREHRHRGPSPEVLQGGVARELPQVAAVGDVSLCGVAANGATVLHPPQQAEHERAHRLGRQVPQRADLFPDADVGGVACPLERVAVHPDGNGAGALQGAADGGAVAELRERVPAHPPLDECRHVRAGRKPALALEIHESAKPFPVRRDELADEPLGAERARVDAPVAPP